MKQNLFNKLWLRVGMIVAIMTTALAGTAWAESYTISFNSTTGSDGTTAISSISDIVASGSDYITSITECEKVYKGKSGYGVKLGSSSAIGKFTMNLSNAGQVNATKITFNACKYGSDNSSLKITINGTSSQTFSLTSDLADYEFTTSSEISSIKIEGVTKRIYVKSVTVTYSTGSAPTVAAPTFSPAAGTYTSALSVTLAQEDAAIILYTTDGSEPSYVNSNGEEYTGPISVTSTTTIKGIAVDDDGNESSVATATYTIVTLEHVGTAADPYTVADARTAIDNNVGLTNVYATGIVSEIPTAYSSQYSNITFNFVDTEGDTEFLQAYRCTGTDAANVQVGDVVVVYGTLTKHSSTYEFGQGCELVSLIHNAAVEAPTFTPVAGTYTSAQSITISTETSGATIYYTTDGTEPTSASTQYTGAISVSTTTTIKAIAVKGSDESNVTTATYHFCSADDPYTVTEALAFPEYQYPANGIYVTGIVSTAPTQTPTNNGELTYYISVDGEATNQLEVYKGKGLEQAAFEAQDDIQVGDIVTIYGNVVIFGTTNPIKEFASGNYLVSFERPAAPVVPAINADDVTIAYDATSGLIEYTIDNSVEGTSLTASTDAAWIILGTVGDDAVPFTCSANEESEDRTATITLSYTGAESVTVTVTQGHYVAPAVDYATLPFEWEGGASADLTVLTGVTANGLGSDYTAHSPYSVKFDNTGDYIQIKTNERPGIVTVGVKMIGGATSSSITVQESADGENFTNVQALTISGAQNSIHELSTTTAFAASSRYVRLYFNKGSNVGVGPITIAQYADIVLSDYTLTIGNPENVNILAVYGDDEEILRNGENAQVTQGTDVTLTITPASGYDFESLTIAGAEEGQTVTPTANPTTEGMWTFTMPAYNVTVSATVVEHVDPVTASYVLATSITSGKRYVIASGTEGSVKVMAADRGNNRGAEEATVANDVLETSEGNEFVITSTDGGYTIYDEGAGYLYAASSSANQLKTEATLDDNNNGIWAISFDAETGAASIVAQGTNTRNVIRFNSANNPPIFACYESGKQSPVYLFEKVEEEETITVSLNAYGYATFASAEPVCIPEDGDFTAWQITAVDNDNKITFEQVTGNVKAGTGLFLKGEEGNITIEVVASGEELEDNILVGFPTSTHIDDGEYYGLSGDTFKKVNGGNVKAGKALLPAEYVNEDIIPSTDVKAFTFVFEDDATGISNLNVNDNLNGAIYNVAGQRLQKMQKGINIVNGKKILK